MKRKLWKPPHDKKVNTDEVHCGNCRHGVLCNPNYKERYLKENSIKNCTSIGCKYKADIIIKKDCVEVVSTCSGNRNKYSFEFALKHLILTKDEVAKIKSIIGHA